MSTKGFYDDLVKLIPPPPSSTEKKDEDVFDFGLDHDLPSLDNLSSYYDPSLQPVPVIIPRAAFTPQEMAYYSLIQLKLNHVFWRNFQ